MKNTLISSCSAFCFPCRRLLQTLALTLLFVVPSFAGELYDQPAFTPAELNKLIDDLPRFRDWVRANKEIAHPSLSASGKPDFLYSSPAADQVTQLGWEPRRFFCVMGRAAAALARIEKGDEFAPHPDMPEVSVVEMEAVRRHLTGLLRAVSNRPAPQSIPAGKASTVTPKK